MIEVDTSIPGTRVVRVLDHIAKQRSLPIMIRVDHGPEFTSLVWDPGYELKSSGLPLHSQASPRKMFI